MPFTDSPDLLNRFLRYVQIDTRSDPHSTITPTTECQWTLLRLLEQELRELGAQDVSLSKHGYVLATIPATSSKAGVPTVALCAHVDTAPNLPSAAKPIVHSNYDGSPIVLPDDPSQVLTVENTPHLKDAIGEDLITGSGTTLLGADDKAGVATIMSAVRYLLAHPEIPHGKLRLCFNPDEEVAAGMSHVELAEIGADFGYTLDGGPVGELNAETFSADSAVLEVSGIAAHPGYATGVMVNALRLAGRFLAALPVDQSPENTAERVGFIHPVECSGSAEKATVRMILRDFELAGLAAHHQTLKDIVAVLQAYEPRARFELTIKEQYRNMRYWLEKDTRPVDFAREACERAGIKPYFKAIRGGTDGSNLTARGLPCPNVFTGMYEIHSQREWTSLQQMAKATECILQLVQVCHDKA